MRAGASPPRARDRLLLVEDNPGDAELALLALEEVGRSRASVTHVASVGAAVHALPGADVVLLDVGLPDAVGLEGLRRIRRARSDVPIVLLTGREDVALAEEALRQGAQDYLHKAELDGSALERSIRYARSRHELLRDLAAADRWATALLHSVSDVVSIHRADGEVEFLSQSGRDAFGWSHLPTVAALCEHVDTGDVAALRRAFAAWVHGGRSPVEFTVRLADGRRRRWESVATNLLDHPAVTGIVVTTRDVTDRHDIERHLVHQALHDQLTGLGNRRFFDERLRAALLEQGRSGGDIALVLLDLDDFKKINDVFGHAAGDDVIRAVARMLDGVTRTGQCVARLGGDEFVFLCEDASTADALELAERIRRLVARPFEVGVRHVHMTGSIGVAVARAAAGLSASDLFRNADLALNETKARGRNGCTMFDAELEARAARRILVEEELRGAIARDELSLVYQPVVELETGRVAWFEALLRWRNQRLGEVTPDEFIAIAEESSLILQIGAWVIERAAGQVATWRRQRVDEDCRVAVNVSALQLAEPNFVDRLAEVLHRTGVPPSAFGLELTETAVMDRSHVSEQVLAELKALGVPLSVDDFGTGYSSLAALRDLPVDVVKVDRSFVAGLGQRERDTAIVSTVVELARSLGLDVVAEGVESQAQAAELRRLGCRLGQGHLWGRAAGVPSGDVARFAVDDEREPVWRPLPPSGASVGPWSLMHELTQLVTIIRGYAETLDVVIDGDAAATRRATAAIGRSIAVIESLVAFVKDADAIERGDIAVVPARLDVGALVVEVVDELRPALPTPLHAEVQGPALAEVDPLRLRQVVSTLLVNVARSAGPGSALTVWVDADRDSVSVAVTDGGAGIPMVRLQDLFARPVRPVRPEAGGIGLFLARQLTRLLGGDLRYRRSAPEGGTFTITLPVTPNAAVRRSSVEEQPTFPASGSIAFDESDAVAARALHRATRALLRARTAEQVVGVAIRLVRELGGDVVPAHLGGPDAMPVDLAFGEGPPLLPAAPFLSVGRMRLERCFPLFVDDAIDLVEGHRTMAPRSPGRTIDPRTGLPRRAALRRSLDREPRGRTFVVFGLDPPASPEAVRALARILHSRVGIGDMIGHWAEHLLVAEVSGAGDAPGELVEAVRDQWLAWGVEGALHAGIASLRRTGSLKQAVDGAVGGMRKLS